MDLRLPSREIINSHISLKQDRLGLPEMGMIELALRDSLIKEGFHYDVKLESA